MKYKLIMLVEANGNTAIYVGSQSNTTKIGTGAVLYEMLEQIFRKIERKNSKSSFKGVELAFFKDWFDVYSCQSMTDASATEYSRDWLFTDMLVNRFAANYADSKSREDIFSPAWQGTLCTGQAVKTVLKRLSDFKSDEKDKTGLVFVSDTPSVFDDMKDNLPTRSQLPDLSVFCLNKEAVRRGCRWISSFKTERSELKIIDYASVQNNFSQAIEAYRATHPDAVFQTENIVKFCLDRKFGIAYSLYDTVKNVFNLNHSVNACSAR